MGRKRTRAREFIFLCTAGLIVFLFLGCASFVEKNKAIEKHKAIEKDKTVEKNSAELKEKEIRKEKLQKGDPQKEETAKILLAHLVRAKRLLEQRDFEGSMKESQKVLSLSNQNLPADEAIFNMGLIYAHFGNPKRDYSKSIGFFRRLMREDPQSPLAEQAKIWSGILQESEKLSQTIQKLNQVIEESKHVDIEIEEKKREKAK